MKRIAIACVLVGLVTFFAAGCGGGGDRAAGEPEGRPAISFQDGQENYHDFQFRCPVCGEEGIKQKFHVDTDEGRVYFDSQDCADTFQEDPQKYLEQYEQMRRSPGRKRKKSK